MANRIQQMRTLLVERLAAAGSTHDWSHVSQQIGMSVGAVGRKGCVKVFSQVTRAHTILLALPHFVSPPSQVCLPSLA